jgi:hypothetical protein
MSLTSQQLTALALDPVLLFSYRGWNADPWQRELLRSKESRILLNCCRQAGKSTVVAGLALHTALFQPGSLILLVSRSQRQSNELFRKVLDFYNALDRPVPRKGNENMERLELANGSRIEALPGDEENIRGFSGVTLAIIDEAARVRDDLYKAIRPMLAVSNGRLACLSTPLGRRGFFYDAWHDVDANWLRLEIRGAQVPRIARASLIEEERSLGASWFSQEFNCSFEGHRGLVYPRFDECLVDDLPAAVTAEAERLKTESARPPRTCYVEPGLTLPPRTRWLGGLDFGVRDPTAAVWGLLDDGDVLWIFGEYFRSNALLHDVAVALPRKVTWYADPAGARERKELRCAGFVIRESDNSIKPGIAAVRSRMETGRIKILRSACPHLIREANLYHYAPDDEPGAEPETPVDRDNHTMDALRYLVARTDFKFMARFRRS